MSIFHPVMDQVCGGTIIPTLAIAAGLRWYGRRILNLAATELTTGTLRGMAEATR